MVTFIPKTSKFVKFQKKKIKNVSTKGTVLIFGTLGLKVTANGQLTSRQLAMVQLTLSKNLKKTGKYWIRSFSHRSITEKPLEVRMGKGKGHVSTWICRLKKGTIICEIATASGAFAQLLLRQISLKLPFSTSVIVKDKC